MGDDLEGLILAAVATRQGGDLVNCRDGRYRGRCFRLADGIHHMRAVARELAQAHDGLVERPPVSFLGVMVEREAHVDRRWQQRFYRAVRNLANRGLLEFPSSVPLAEDKSSRAEMLRDGLYLLHNQGRYARATGAAIEPPRVAACRECDAPMPQAHHARKLCSDKCRRTALAKRNAAVAAQRLDRRKSWRARVRTWQGGGCKRCHKDFQAARASQEFCSNACRQADYRKRHRTE